LGEPRHGEGARRHFVPVKVTDKPISPGGSVDLNIEEQLGEFAHSSHRHLDTSQIEMWPYIVDFADEYSPAKRWLGGKYLPAPQSVSWKEAPNLNLQKNRKIQKAPASSTATCYVYNNPSNGPCANCNSGETGCDSSTFCRVPTFRFKFSLAGVHLIQTCYSCVLLDAQGNCDPFGMVCAGEPVPARDLRTI